MKITVEYWNQLREAAEIDVETIELADGSDIAALMRQLATRHSASWSALVFAVDGTLRPSTIISINGEVTSCRRPPPLRHGDVLALLMPVAGG